MTTETAPDLSQEHKCNWYPVEDGDHWDTSCKHAFTIIDGSPSQNGMKFCCYCSYPIREMGL